MAEDNQPFEPEAVAEFTDGTQVVPQSKKEQEWLINIANSNQSPDMKEKTARLGALFEPQRFDAEFTNNKRKALPTDLDPQLRQMIRES